MAGRPQDEIWLSFQRTTKIAYNLYISNLFFTEDAVSAVTPADWWSLIAIDQVVKEDIRKKLCCMTTTAELERLFSTFGFVHASSRNRLGVEKCGKLVFCFRVFNQ